MNQLQTMIEHAEQHCQQQRVRLTAKRKCVLVGLLQSQKAMSAYELVDYCKTQLDQTIPAMSVYRILDFLQDQGLVHRLDLANKYVACSHASCSHNHELLQFLICDQCQSVEEINIDPSVLQNLQKTISQTGFHLSSPQLEINGICNKCFSSQTNIG